MFVSVASRTVILWPCFYFFAPVSPQTFCLSPTWKNQAVTSLLRGKVFFFVIGNKMTRNCRSPVSVVVQLCSCRDLLSKCNAVV